LAVPNCIFKHSSRRSLAVYPLLIASLKGIPDNLIQSIIMNESFNNPIYVRVEGSKFGVGYQNKDDSNILHIFLLNRSIYQFYLQLYNDP
jgi:hypothetical protein